MPIEYQVDHTLRLVRARGYGLFSDADIFGYQKELSARTDVAGYDELVDMTDVTGFTIGVPASPHMERLAEIASREDVPEQPGKFAIIAPNDLAFGLGRQYQMHREMNPQSVKQVGVFRSREEAMSFLGLDE